jgi:uncharacterized membrane protein YeaQ/YmgE (transglycosylase-associated protein family)
MEEHQIGWIAAIIIGGIAGWLAEQFMKSQMGLVMNIVLGVIGAAVARACTHKIAIGDIDLINVRFGPLCGLRSDITRSPRMGWTGRAPTPNGSQSERGPKSTRSAPP